MLSPLEKGAGVARYSRVFLESERRAVAIRPEEGGYQRAE